MVYSTLCAAVRRSVCYGMHPARCLQCRPERSGLEARKNLLSPHIKITFCSAFVSVFKIKRDRYGQCSSQALRSSHHRATTYTFNHVYKMQTGSRSKQSFNNPSFINALSEQRPKNYAFVMKV